MRCRYLLLFVWTVFFCKGQDAARQVDSLKRALSASQPDSNRVNLLMSMVSQYINLSEYNQAMSCDSEALALSSKINFPKGEIDALSKRGNIYLETGEYDKCMASHNAALAIATRINDKKAIAGCNNNLGGINLMLSNFDKARDYYQAALKLREEIGDKYGVAVCYTNLGNIEGSIGNYAEALRLQLRGLHLKEELIAAGNKEITERSLAKTLGNIGIIYQLQDQYKEALDFQKRALAINIKFNDRKPISESYNNIGNIYYSAGNKTLALAYFGKCLAIREEINDRSGIAGVTNNMGVIYKDLGEYDKALELFKRSLALAEALGEKDGVTNVYINLGSVYLKLKQYALSEDYYKKALVLGKELEILDDEKECYKGLSDLYKATGKYQQAYDYFVKYVTCRDSLVNEKNTKKMVQAEMNYEFAKKEAFTNAQHDKETAVATAESKKQKVIIVSISVALALVAVFALFAYRNYRQKQKANFELGVKNDKLEHAYEIIEEKNREVTDSIQYARRIQRAMITSDAYISKFLEDFFIFYQPKDIVSGDFYWAVNHAGKFYMIVADCTGHGVPGAFMSLLNISFLNEIVLEKNVLRPDLILNEQRRQIIRALNPTGMEESKDGMDCVLFALDLNSLELEYAAANNSFYIIRDGAILHCQADKMPVGKGEDERPFTYSSIRLQKGDVLYIFTDGFADQFGGPKGKKFKYRQFEELLLANSHRPVGEQPAMLEAAFKDWRGGLEQVDDVLVLGFKI